MDDWSLALRLARRELRGGLKGFRIFLACLVLGVGAIAAVGSLSRAITTGLAEDARAILGGDVSVRLSQRPANEQERAFFDAAGEVSLAVDLHAMARPVDGDGRSIVELKAIDGNYPLYGELVTDPPLTPPALFGRRNGLWGLAVDPNLLARLGVEVGARLKIGEALFQVRAAIVREPDRVGGTRGFAFGPRVLLSTEALPETGLVTLGSLIRYFYRLRLGESRSAASWISDLNAAFPDAGWRVRDMSNSAPGLERLIGRLTQFMTLVGLTALLVGGVGVGNAVRSYLEGKATIIATLKCLGAPIRLIFRTYLAQILIRAGVGIALGLALGALAPLAAAVALADLLPVSARPALYPEPLALAAAFGLLTALAFSIWPVARACEVPAGSLFRSLVAPVGRWPRRNYVALTGLAALALAALAVAAAEERRFALWFVLGAVAALATFWLAGLGVTALARRVHGTRHPGLRLALANLHRPGAPTASVVLSLGLGLTVLVAIAMIEGNLGRMVNESLLEEAPGFYFIDIQADQIADFRALAEGTEGVRRVHNVPILRGRVVAIDGVPARQAVVAPDAQWVLRGDRGITWSALPPENNKIVAGRWWPADYSGTPLISLDAEIANGFGIGIGDTLTVNILGREISGEIANLRQIDWATLGINFVIMFSPGVLEQAPQTHLATVYAEPEVELALETAILDRFANVSSIRVKEALETIGGIIADIGLAVRLVALVTLVAGALVLAGAIAAGHRRRVYDSVVLKVLGATRRNLAAAFLMEYGLLGLITAAIAGVLGTAAAAAVMIWIMDIDWVFLPGVVATTALLCAALTIAVGFAGTWRALGQKAAPLLRSD